MAWSSPPARRSGPPHRSRSPDSPTPRRRWDGDCPPVEELWEQDKEVTDPCTIAAVSTALRLRLHRPGRAWYGR